MRGTTTTRVAPARPSSSTATATMTLFVTVAVVASFCVVNVILMSRLVEMGGMSSSSSSHHRTEDDGGTADAPMTTKGAGGRGRRGRGRKQRRAVASGGNVTTTRIDHEDEGEGEDPVLSHFRRAGLDLDDMSRSMLPSWSYVESQYGKDVLMMGLDRCEAYRQNVPPLRRNLGSAGMFNSGTNLVSFATFFGGWGGGVWGERCMRGRHGEFSLIFFDYMTRTASTIGIDIYTSRRSPIPSQTPFPSSPAPPLFVRNSHAGRVYVGDASDEGKLRHTRTVRKVRSEGDQGTVRHPMAMSMGEFSFVPSRLGACASIGF
jgi:hypothetical protein